MGSTPTGRIVLKSTFSTFHIHIIIMVNMYMNGEMNMILLLDDIKKVLKKKAIEYNSEFRFGIAGSYARNEATNKSDLDVVIDGNSMKQDVAEDIKNAFPLTVDVLWLDLLKAEDEDLMAFCKANNYPINEDSVYKTVLREVIWIESK